VLSKQLDLWDDGVYGSVLNFEAEPKVFSRNEREVRVLSVG